VVKKEKEPHNKAMIAKSDEHANILRAKNAEVAVLRVELSSTITDLTRTQRLATRHERTINKLWAEGRATRTLVVKYLAVSHRSNPSLFHRV